MTFKIGQEVVCCAKRAKVVAIEAARRGKPVFTIRYADGREERRGTFNLEAMPEFQPAATIAELNADGRMLGLLKRASRPGGSFE